MASKTVTAMFDRYAEASAAVGKLESAGIPHDQISIVSNDATERSRHDTAGAGRDHDDAKTGAGTGASVGTLVGGGAGLLAGLGLLAIPGIGPVVAAGWLASTLLGAGLGAATGGIVGGLTGAGIDEADAHSYAEGIRRGGTLVTVKTDDAHYARVTDILDDEGTVDMNQREATWRSEGWSGRNTGADYAPGTTGSMAGGAMGAAGSTTTGLGAGGALGTGGMGSGTGGVGSSGTLGGGDTVRTGESGATRGRVRTYPAV